MQNAREKITELLEQTIGLKSTAIGVSTLDRAVNTRMRVTESQDIAAYLERLGAVPAEIRRLVEEVVVPETWFFRDQDPFIYLAEYIAHIDKDLKKDFLRILSLPCSTGEEPYSIAMTLLLAGLPPAAFFIDAVDVSERVLERARQGLYRDNSFRSKDLSFRDIFFSKGTDGYQLRPTVREKVRFLQGNLIQPGFMERLGRYDVVFCRNVLIYFNEESQRQAIEALHRALLPGGVLFTGHAEASLLYNTNLFTVARAKAFAFSRQQPPAKKSCWQQGNGSSPAASWSPPPAPAVAPGRGFGAGRAAAPRPQETEFARVSRLADEGMLEEAARQCEEYLRQHDPSPEWYYLFGIIRDSLGQPEEALKLLRKALYLDPENMDSLVHLSLLAERAGDVDGAANYRRRLRKLREGGKDLWREKT